MLRIGALRGRLLSASALASILSVATLAANAGALPGNGHYVAGQGSVNKAGQSLTVKQSSTTGIIDWNSFSIARKTGVRFDNGSGATLNRVTGGNLSRIAGSLHATGSLYLMNSSGVIVSGSGRVVTGGSFVASSGNISNTAFDNGNRRFLEPKAAVVNRGSITAGGNAALIGGAVTQAGAIDAASVNLSARTGLIISGTVVAQNVDGSGGAVSVRARNIAQSGTIDASAGAAGKAGGSVSIIAMGDIKIAGTISATGGAGAQGGQIETSGHTLEIGSTKVDAGTGGSWLLDPYDLTVDGVAATTIDNTLGAGTDVVLQTTASGTSGPGTPNASGNGDIFIDSPLAWDTSATLTLDAYRNIEIDSSIAAPAGGLTLNAAGTISDIAAIGIGQFTLQGGAWSQDVASPPSFSATSFTLSGGSFLRVTGGDGVGSPYQIFDIYGLQGIASSADLASASYVLANDIDASGTAGWNSGAGFVPIGSYYEFDGTFDGQGYTISNLTINLPSAEFVGLFGASGGTIRNLGLIGGLISGAEFVGALVGENAGTIENSYATSAVSGSAGSSYVGGLAGDNLETITNSYATGSVSGGSYVGGLAGQNDFGGSISDSYATGAVSGGSYVGGFVGYNFIEATIDQSYETGAVSGGSNVGGFAGKNDGTLGNTTADYFNSTANSGSGVGSGPGFARGGGLSFAAMQTASNFSGWTFGTTGGASGWVIVDQDSTLNNAAAATGGTTPMLLGEYSTTIQNAHQLQLMQLDPNANYTLGGDIDASATAGGDVWGSQGFAPIGNYYSFTGTFDGQNHTISNLIINLPSAYSGYAAGLFGVSDGTIHNVGLIGGSVSGAQFVGALVGVNEGAIDNSYATSAVSGSSFVGGLVGDNFQGTISDSYATGSVSGGSYVGGLAGQNDIEGTISDSYATGAISGGSYVGGFVGYNFIEATISDAYWDTTTSGTTTGSGGNDGTGSAIGLTTAQLQGALPGTFSNTTWGTGPGLYPYLLWQYPTGTPQAVSGFAYTDHGVTGLNAGSVSLLIGGTAMGTASTGANGYYYFLEAPGTISGSQILTYLPGTGGAAFADNATGSVSGLDIDNNYLNETTAGSSYATVVSDLATAIGGNSAAQAIVSGLANQSIDYTGSAAFTIDSAISLGSGTLAITANGAVNQTAAIGANNLLLLGSADYTLDDAGNAIATVAGFTTGSLSLTSNEALSVGSVEGVNGLDVGGGAGLTTTSGDITILQLLTADAHPLTLTSAGAITESGSGAIGAASLSGTSDGTVTLNGANTVSTLAGFNTDDHDFAFTDATALSVSDTLDADSGNVTLTTTADSISLNAEVRGDDVTLNSATTITQTAGTVDAGLLVGMSAGGTTLTSASNEISALGQFTNAGAGGFALTNNGFINIVGAVNGGTGALSFDAIGSGIALQANLITTGTVSLTSGGTIAQDSGVIEAATLMGTSDGAVTLNGANVITDLDAFSTGGNNAFSLGDAHDLTTTGAVNSGTAGLTLTTTGSGHDIAIDSALTGGTVKLTSAGTIGESTSSGEIIATTLTGSSIGKAEMNGATNTITDLGAFTSGGAFALTDDNSLTLDGTLDAGSHTVRLTTTGSGHDIAVDAVLEGGTVGLFSSADISEDIATGTIAAERLHGSSNELVSLNGANLISNLRGFDTGGNHAFALSDAHALRVHRTVDTGTAKLSLTTTGLGNNLYIEGTLEGGTVALNSAGKIHEYLHHGVIDATTLTGSSAWRANLHGVGNSVARLDGFVAGGHRFFRFTDDRDLTVDGTVIAGTVNLAITGEATENSSGAIRTKLLNVAAQTGIKLTSLNNDIAVLGTDTTVSGPNKIKGVQ